MSAKTSAIIFVKITHSLIWLIMVLAIFYILFSGITGNINIITYFSIGLLVIEMLVLLLNNWACPLTIIAKRVNPEWNDGDDIFLPRWLAIHNKEVFGTLLAVGIILVIFRLLIRNP